MDVVTHGHVVLEEVLGLPTVERVGPLKCLLEVLGAWPLPLGGGRVVQLTAATISSP